MQVVLTIVLVEISGAFLFPPLVSQRRQRTDSLTICIFSANIDDDISVSVSESSSASKSKLKGRPDKKITAKKKKKKEPMHWSVDSDVFILQNQDLSLQVDTNSTGSTSPTMLRFKIRGNPRPLRRHRTGAGFMYNPSALAQASFRDSVEQLVSSKNTAELLVNKPLFDEYLAVSIVFSMKRPMKHFVGNIRGLDRMRSNAPPQLSPILSDVSLNSIPTNN
jgi:hypothetical protein